MKPVYFHPEAEAELEAGVTYYESRKSGLGIDFQSEVESTVWRIRSDPQRWATHQETGLQRCHLKRFPYTIYFLDSDEGIWIAAVAHQKREPGYWVSRHPND